MNKIAHTALMASIKAWKAKTALIKKSIGRKYPASVNIGATYCPLCDEFLEGEISTCRGCPVMEKTRQTCCCSTPFYDVTAIDKTEPVSLDTVKKFQAEVDFLKSLIEEVDEE